MRLREQPVVADGAADAADRRVGDRKERLVVARRGRAGWRGPRRESTGSPCGTCRGCPSGPIRQVVLKTHARPARIGLEHRAALDVDVVLARLGVRADRCARWESARPACSSSSATVAKTGAACANSGNTTSRTGRNGALPATAASIIASMRSVFARICARSIGFGEVGLAGGGGVADARRSLIGRRLRRCRRPAWPQDASPAPTSDPLRSVGELERRQRRGRRRACCSARGTRDAPACRG